MTVLVVVHLHRFLFLKSPQVYALWWCDFVCNTESGEECCWPQPEEKVMLLVCTSNASAVDKGTGGCSSNGLNLAGARSVTHNANPLSFPLLHVLHTCVHTTPTPNTQGQHRQCTRRKEHHKPKPQQACGHSAPRTPPVSRCCTRLATQLR